MNNPKYILNFANIGDSAEFHDATAEELRVLILITSGGISPTDTRQIAELAGCTAARAKAAVTLWLESDLLTEYDGSGITEEHVSHLRRGELTELSAKESSDIIRDDQLAPLLDECARMLGRAALNRHEAGIITALTAEYTLNEEYILMLAAHLVAKKSFTVAKLRDEAIRLSAKGYDTAAKLEKYIKEQEYLEGVEWEYRRLLGITGRIPSERECEFIRRWSGELGYSVEAVKVAYDVCVMNLRKVSLPYMDRMLTAWHEAGCRTAAECRAKQEADKAARAAERRSPAKKGASRAEAPTPKYGDFDVNEAFAAALNRSFGNDDE